MKIAEKLIKMAPYEPVVGDYAVRLDANESPFAMPEEMARRLVAAAVKEELNRYPDPDSTLVRGAAAEYYGVSPEMVIAGNGSDELIGLLYSSLVEKGDKVLTFAPDFAMYPFYSSLCEVNAVTIQKGPSLALSADEIIEAIDRERPAMTIFSNPCNPTGQGLPRSEVERIIESCQRTILVVDEAYMDFWDQSAIDSAVKSQNVIVLRTCSKALGLAGLRLGFGIANPYLIGLLNRSRSPYNINSLTQRLARDVLADQTYLARLRSEILALKNKFEEELLSLAARYPEKMAVLPSKTNFCAVRPTDGDGFQAALVKNSIAVRYFPALSLMRVTAGTEAENRRFVQVTEEFLKG